MCPIRLQILLLIAFLTGCSASEDSISADSGIFDSGPSPGPGPEPGDNGLPAAFDRGAVYVNEIYIDGNAASNGNGSAAQPFDNIADGIAAARVAGPGSRINVAAGTYPAIPYQADLRGESGAPLALVANGPVIIDAGGSGTGMALSNPRYMVIDGFTIQNTGVHGINLDDGGDYATPGEFVVLRNLHFRDIGRGGNHDCLKMSGIDRFRIENSEFEGCNQGEAIDMVGCHEGIIRGNYFHDVLVNAVQTKGGSADILIHGNRFVDIPLRAINAGGNTGAPFIRPTTAAYEAANINIIANWIERSGQAAVVYAGCYGCIVSNNTIVNPQSSVFWAVEENTSIGPGKNGVFINNIVIFNNADLSDFSFFNSNGLSEIDTFTIDANLWFARDDADFSTLPNGAGFPIGGNNIVQADPLLDADGRPSSGSPAIGAGILLPGNVLPDYDGNDYASPPSIGAFETP